ncbi:MAG: adenylate/guanylate cyclase domain-containing protein, partial [Chlamydiia bacterium]|nr:adenylate/guanylate cyclase domain-containing protein [Chlamydiia bacterium]
IIAMLLLARISKRLTTPITQLAKASEEIGKGKYENLELHKIESRQDEIGILSHSFEKMAASLRDREKIRGVLNKVVSKEIASKILEGNVELGGEERRITMLFSDIRGFTPLSETMSPQQLIGLLNTYMTHMCAIIDETHGVVDKFVGDEIMALYGAPLDLKEHADQAIEGAMQMMIQLQDWNRNRGEPHLSIGIGIHTGSVFAGNMGAADRLNYTVVGANVNLAARLCSAAQPMQILISEETYHALADPHRFPLHPLPPMLLKGIDTPVAVYELRGFHLR